MKIKEVIDQIFEENTNYTHPGQAINQAISLELLSSDVYSETKRFVFELIQNADDAAEEGKSVKMHLKFTDDYLIVSHTGKPFSKRDFRGICGVGNGTKAADATKTGYKGIGFKSVFGKSEKVYIRSLEDVFYFDQAQTLDIWKWKGSKASWEAENEREFKMPWQIIPFYATPDQLPEGLKNTSEDYRVSTIIQVGNSREIEDELYELLSNPEIMLFLRHIKEISVEGLKPLKLTKKSTDDENTVALRVNDDKEILWLCRNFEVDVPEHTRKALQNDSHSPKKLQGIQKVELSLAARLDEGRKIEALKEKEGLIYTYLPTKVSQYSFPFLVNSNFLIDAGRGTLHEDRAWNQFLFEQIGYLSLQWLSELAHDKQHQQSILHLLPKMYPNARGLEANFNQGLARALENTAFIPSQEGRLLKATDTLVDTTGLLQEDFVQDETITSFFRAKAERELDKASFPVYLESRNKLKDTEAYFFDKTDIIEFLSSGQFLDSHTVADNLKLISFLKKKSDKDEQWDEFLRSLAFIMDKEGILLSPQEIYFEPDKEFTLEAKFIHPEVLEKITDDREIYDWLIKLGVRIASNASFIKKTVLGEAYKSINEDTAIEYLRLLFDAYQKNEIGFDDGKSLEDYSHVKLLTKQGKLKMAKECYLPNKYKPTLPLEEVLDADVFITENYIRKEDSEKAWGAFFVELGVKEKITRETKSFRLGNPFISNEYFERAENKAKEGHRYPHLISKQNEVRQYIFTFFEHTTNYQFSFIFWNYVIVNIPDPYYANYANMAWGYYGYTETVESILNWAIQNKKIIPTTQEVCEKASRVFLNDPIITEIAGKYLPIIDCEVNLPANWRSLLNLKTSLKLEDYLIILRRISEDITKNERKVKADNNSRIRILYEKLAASYKNMSELDQREISDWGTHNKLLSTDGSFYAPSDLCLLQGNISLPADTDIRLIKSEPHLNNDQDFLGLMRLFGVRVLRDEDFELVVEDKTEDEALSNRLNTIAPYLALISSNTYKRDYSAEYEKIIKKISKKVIYRASSIKNMLEEQVVKQPRAIFHQQELHYVKAWDNALTLYDLPAALCHMLSLKGMEKEMDLLLRTQADEVDEWLENQKIGIHEAFLEDIKALQVKASEYSDDVNEEVTVSVKADVDKILDVLRRFNLELDTESVDKLNHILESYQNLEDFENEENVPISDSNHLPTSDKYEKNKVAYESARKLLEQEGYVFTQAFSGSVVDGVMLKGVEYPMVIKSYQNTSFKLNITPGEWVQLSKPNAAFIIYSGNGEIKKVNLEGMFAENRSFHMHFITSAFRGLDGLTKFVSAFERVKGVRFQMDAPVMEFIVDFADLRFNKQDESALPPTESTEII